MRSVEVGVAALLMLVISAMSLELPSVKNFRPVFPSRPDLKLYRSAALEEISREDADTLLRVIDEKGCVIDLRNLGEGSQANTTIKSDGGRFLYDEALEYGEYSGSSLRHHPLIFSQRFWPRVEEELGLGERISGFFRSLSQDRGWERQLALKLEERGLGLLYEVILDTARPEIVDIMKVIESTLQEDAPVVFHCAKGKDRTGIISAILHMLEGSLAEDRIVEEYSLSEKLLGEVEGSGKAGDGVIDWRKLRGTPPAAMRETLAYMAQRGGCEAYLLEGGLERGSLERLKACLRKNN